jgi:alpha-tubulin suppressor-like RCC1 family protein
VSHGHYRPFLEVVFFMKTDVAATRCDGHHNATRIGPQPSPPLEEQPMRPRLVLLSLAVGLSACSDPTSTTAPNARYPRFDIADAARDYKSGFYWLPPIVRQPTVSGMFDASLTPTVEICELVGDSCGDVIAIYTTTTGPGGETVRLQDGTHYQVNWHAKDFELSTTSSYRISVRAGTGNILLGYADVQPANNANGFRNLDSGELMGLVDGRTLPIRFRIETGIVGSVELEPATASVSVGGTQQFVATIRDLHGNVISAPVAWASSDESIATIDQMGLATGVAEGVATITATSDRISGTASLTVVGDGGGTEGTVVVSAGNGHTCAIDAEGNAFCWGLGTSGQLGNGLTLNSPTPVAVSGGLTFATIDVNLGRSCAVTTAGAAYCWGTAPLGDGSTSNSLTPVAVSSQLTFGPISVGPSHACAISTGGVAHCWGAGTSGRLGTGSEEQQLAPAAVLGELTFASISAGQNHTCGITTAGAAYCWGTGARGRLGNGDIVNQLAPTPVAGGLSFTAISAGAEHTCGVSTSGQTYCWGAGTSGRLGTGEQLDAVEPVPVASTLLFTAISAGENHSCAIATDGLAYCWGNGLVGQLGTGVQQSFFVPTRVASDLLFASISAGASHTCAVTTSGDIYCWGFGTTGQLGNGDLVSRFSPTPIAAFPEMTF